MDRPVPEPHRRHRMASCPSFAPARRIGVMGGSFNPAHAGHLYIARQARQSAQLDEVWWLVSPQNPLKSAEGMARFEDRLAGGRHLAAPHHWLRCLDIEEYLQLKTSYASLTRLQKICPRACLIWIMGADNLSQFPKWYRARDIAANIPILVMNRPGYGWQALFSKGAAYLGRRNRRHEPRLLGRRHAHNTHKAGREWAFTHKTRNPLSATVLRGNSG